MDEIVRVPYNADWPAAFAREAEAIRQALVPRTVVLEHVGSTAVQGLTAKPVIDILLIEPDPSVWPALIAAMNRLGYAFWDENPDKSRVFFVKGLPPAPRRTHHVHVVDSTTAERIIAFRDALRNDESLAKKYADLKHRLAGQFGADRDAYTDAKAHFIGHVLGPIARPEKSEEID